MENKLTVQQLAEAHLMNVQREISSLNNQKAQIEAEIKRLTEYLNNGVDTIRGSLVETVSKVDPGKYFEGQ